MMSILKEDTRSAYDQLTKNSNEIISTREYIQKKRKRLAKRKISLEK